MENNWIFKKQWKTQKEAEILGLCDARDNTAISIDHLSTSIICYLQPYFQCQRVQNNLKSETSIAMLNQEKPEIFGNLEAKILLQKKNKKSLQVYSDFKIIGFKPLFSLN